MRKRKEKSSALEGNQTHNLCIARRVLHHLPQSLPMPDKNQVSGGAASIGFQPVGTQIFLNRLEI